MKEFFRLRSTPADRENKVHFNMSNFSHPKCYANKTNQCSTKISGEHFISNNILKVFEENKKVKVTGLPWIENQTFNLFSPSVLIANILCKKHNEDLSPFDAEAGNLHRCISEFDSDFNSISPTNDVIRFNGDCIEKWMLKTICGLIASNQIAQKSEREKIILNDKYIDILFNKTLWPEGWGLYFKIPKSNQIQRFDCLSVVPMIGNNEVKCAEFLFNNFMFYLVLGKPNDPNYWGIHRVNKIHLTDGRVTKIIEFEWNNEKYNQTIELKRIGISKDHPQDWDDWMKK